MNFLACVPIYLGWLKRRPIADKPIYGVPNPGFQEGAKSLKNLDFLRKAPVLLTPTQVKKVLGRVPRDLENMVQADPKGRKLYLRSEVLKRCK